MEVLFGSRNVSKTRRMQALFATLGIELVAVGDASLPDPEEGADVEQNARIKARYYANHVWAPCIANDYGLTLEGLADDAQPAAQVRRRVGGHGRATDEEAMQYYVDCIRGLGGRTRGTWTGALAIALSPERVVSVIAQHTRTFVDCPSPVVLPGEPLASLQVDPETGEYLSERAYVDRARAPSPVDRAYLDLVLRHMDALRAAASRRQR